MAKDLGSMPARGGALLGAALLLLLPRSAGAAPEPWQRPGFQHHYYRGRALYHAQKYEPAIAELQAAYDIYPLERLLCDIAHAERKRGDLRRALALFTQCLQSDRELTVQDRAEVERRVAELRAMLPGPEAAPPPPQPAPLPAPPPVHVTEPEPPPAPVALPPPPPVDPPARALARPGLLVAARTVIASRERRPAWRIGTGTAALAVGAGLLGFGAWGVAVNGNGLCTLVPPKTQCSENYGSLAQGAGSLGAGAALLITGVVLIAVPGRRLRPRAFPGPTSILPR